MAGDWIKVETCLPEKPEVFTLAERLDMDPDMVVGKLIRFWRWVDQHTESGHARSVTEKALDHVLGVTGFAQALVLVGWLEVTDDGIAIPNHDRHLSQTAKTRALASNRQKRKRSRTERDTCVTREEKRREESISPPKSPQAEPGGTSLTGGTTLGEPPPDWEDRWVDFCRVYPGAKKYAERGKKAFKVACGVEDPDKIVSAARKFAQSRLGRSANCPKSYHWLKTAMWCDDPTEWDTVDHTPAETIKLHRKEAQKTKDEYIAPVQQFERDGQGLGDGWREHIARTHQPEEETDEEQ